MSPFKLVYGKPCHLPVEIEHKAFWAIREINTDSLTAGEERILELHELEEMLQLSYENTRILKERTKKVHDEYIMRGEFKEGDQVLLLCSQLRFFPGKLKSRWSGPFEVKKVYPYGAVEIGRNDEIFKVNGQRLKLYIAGQMNRERHILRLSNPTPAET